MEIFIQRFLRFLPRITQLEEQETGSRIAGPDVREQMLALADLLAAARLDVPASLNKIRHVIEGYLAQLCAEHQVSWGNKRPSLENMVGPLRSEGVLPQSAYRHLTTIQTYASPGSHYQLRPEDKVTLQDLRTTLGAFVGFLQWYYALPWEEIRKLGLDVEGEQIENDGAGSRWWKIAITVAVILVLAVAAWLFLEYRQQQQWRLHQLHLAIREVTESVDAANDSGDLIRAKMAKGLEALALLSTEHGQSEAEIAGVLTQAPAPSTIFEFGPAGIPEELRARVVVDAVRNARTFLEGLLTETRKSVAFAPRRPDGDGDRMRFAEWSAALWALDRFAVGVDSDNEAAQKIRAEMIDSLRREFGAPQPFNEADWIAIPEGAFRMGSAVSNNLDERPVHQVAVSNFKIHRHETTNEEFGRFLSAWQSGAASEPATGMSWYEAYAYAAWLGARLLTEAEWEYAARDGREQDYPWGDEDPDCAKVTFQGCGTGPAAVCGRPAGATETGVCDMAGNVWEWVADWYDAYPMDEKGDTLGPMAPNSDLDGRVVRGGSFKGTAETVRAAKRHAWPAAAFNQQTGLRLARDP